MPQQQYAPPQQSLRRSSEALAMLRADHRRIQQLIMEYDTVHGPQAQRDIAHEILLELTIHAHLKAYVFYDTSEDEPTRRGQTLLAASRREQRAITGLLQELRMMAPEDPQFPKTFDELLLHVEHHMAAEEAQMFPFAEAALAHGSTACAAGRQA